MSDQEPCHLCGMKGDHTRQCSARIKVDSKAADDRWKRKKELDSAKEKMPKPKLSK